MANATGEETAMTQRRLDYSKRESRNICAAGVQDALEVLDGRWKMLILAQLAAGPMMRFSELQRAIPKASQKMLIQQLRDLERHGIVDRKVYTQVPPKVEYGLTELGQGLRPVYLALLDWGELHREAAERSKQASDEPSQSSDDK